MNLLYSKWRTKYVIFPILFGMWSCSATSSGSILVETIYSSIAQSVEHAAVNRAVVGSSPTRGAYLMIYHEIQCDKAT